MFNVETHLHIIDDKLVESVGHHMTSLLVGAIAYTGHEVLTFEPSPHSVVDTLRLPPVGLRERQVEDTHTIHTTRVHQVCTKITVTYKSLNYLLIDNFCATWTGDKY